MNFIIDRMEYGSDVEVMGSPKPTKSTTILKILPERDDDERGKFIVFFFCVQRNDAC